MFEWSGAGLFDGARQRLWSQGRRQYLHRAEEHSEREAERDLPQEWGAEQGASGVPAFGAAGEGRHGATLAGGRCGLVAPG
ncbi:hypothetical protein ACIGPN_29445 [Streptomyces afghaniensis]|uniref:hypothetical protein n=1 Tax=Streptomyces afghaniensis TaxID=66865 RepID=UPI0037D57B2B